MTSSSQCPARPSRLAAPCRSSGATHGVARLFLLVAIACCPTAVQAFTGASSAESSPAPVHPGMRLQEVRPRGAAEIELEARTGGAWQLHWDAVTGIATRGAGGRAPGKERVAAQAVAARADAFIAAHGQLLGVTGSELQRVRLHQAGRAWHVTWVQMHAGRRVVDCSLELTTALDGTVVAFRSSLVPDLQPTAGSIDAARARDVVAAALQVPVHLDSAEPVVVVLAELAAIDAVEALELELSLPSGARWRAWVEAGSYRLLELEDRLRTEVLNGWAVALVHPKYAHDDLVDVPLVSLEVNLGFNETDPRTYSNAAGDFHFDHTPGDIVLRSSLRGRYVNVDNGTRDPSPHFEKLVTIPSAVEMRFGAAEARPDERAIYYHTNTIHDFMQSRFGFEGLDFPVPAVAAATDPTTGDPNYPNAYWNGAQMGFGNGGATFWNLGLFADVIYHEYTHAVTETMYRPVGDLKGPIGGAMHEGLADYFAATMTGEPDLGEFLSRRTTAPLRSLENRLIWPEHRDRHDEPHANGRFLGAALWDLRQLAGPSVADALAHFARELHPRSFEEFLDALLLQDDLLYDDGWSGNGSPHRETILRAFAFHGMGLLADRELQITHTALGDTEDSSSPRIVTARLRSFLRDEGGFIRLSYRTNGEFQHTGLELRADGTFVGALPPMPAGTQVEYYLSAARYEPVLVQYLPAGAPGTTFRYRVGEDREPPVIEHEPLQQVPAFAWPAELVMQLHDNLGLATAHVEVWRRDEVLGTLGLTAVPEVPGRFVAQFPNVGGEVGEEFEYAITAVDASRAGNVTRLPPSGRLRVQLVQDLDEGFEGSTTAWQHRAVVLGHDDAWQLTTAFNHGPAGQRAWLCGATSGEYPPQTAAELRTAWYRLELGAEASIWSWMQADADADGAARDGGRIEIQAEGETTWSLLTPDEGYTHSSSPGAVGNVLGPASPCLSGQDPTWRRLHFALEEWARQRVRLRFLFGSDLGAPPAGLRGWLLDDFHLEPGARQTTAVLEPLPTRLQLEAAPNPFNPTVTLTLHVPAQAGRLRLEILDARGRVQRRLLDAAPDAGIHLLHWDGRNAAGLESPSGVYYYRLVGALALETGKLVLLR